MKRTPLQIALAKPAPSISIRTIWEHGSDCGPISKDCDGFTPADDDEWDAWQSEITATAIIGGEEVTGHAHLGGTWEKFGDDPAESNPDISGYEPQMTEDALNELLGQLEKLEDPFHYLQIQTITFEIGAALDYLKAHMQASYDAQRAEIEAGKAQAPA